MDMTTSVRQRYTAGAKTRQEDLCCPVEYDANLLKALPPEIVERDYGCGDPSRYVRDGDVVLDLGSGSGKVCYMAAQLVGSAGMVIGVDMNDDMLALARKYQPQMRQQLGDDRVRFLKARIEDLAIDLEVLERYLADNPVRTLGDLETLEHWKTIQRRDHAAIPDASVDLVISNCVLNLVGDDRKHQLIREIRRVLKPGGRVAISDIVSDEDVPTGLKSDADLWSGCIAGAFQEERFLTAFVDAGFVAVRYDQWSADPWRIVEGIEFRSVTLTAMKPDDEACWDRGQAVIYRGPYASVTDDEQHVFPRGARMAVCERTFRLLTEGPYQDDFIGISPADKRQPIAWCAAPGSRRNATDTKGAAVLTTAGKPSCC